MGEHLPYKQRVIGSSPIVPTNGPVVQLVRTLACHARGRGFESHPGRQYFASVAQLVEHVTENHSVVGSIPTRGTICGFSSFGRARPCQGRGGGFEPRNPLQQKKKTVRKFELSFKIKWSGLRGSNPPPSPWQGDALPNELNPHMVPPVGIEPTTRGFSVPCSTN